MICKHCNNFINDDTAVCRYCGNTVNGSFTARIDSGYKNKKGSNALVGCVIVLIILVIVLIIVNVVSLSNNAKADRGTDVVSIGNQQVQNAENMDFDAEETNDNSEQEDFVAEENNESSADDNIDSDEMQTDNDESVYIGDIVEIGNTEWQVFGADEDKVFLICRSIVAVKEYNTENTNTTWSDCSLRKWLNNEYLNSTFSIDEINNIIKVEIITPNNTENNTPGGPNTVDRIFLLSDKDAEKNFSSDEHRIVKNDNGENCWWWLRTPGYGYNTVARVDNTGKIRYEGAYVDGSDPSCGNGGVRPAFFLKKEAYLRYSGIIQ